MFRTYPVLASVKNHMFSTAAKMALMPVLFLSHGGGPCFYMTVPPGHPFKEMDSTSQPADFFRKLSTQKTLAPHWPPKAILVISAHWEESTVTVLNGDKHPLLFDYYGFPAETYELKWPAPGSPALATRVTSLLKANGIPVRADAKRGMDHGVFVPLKLAVPEADIPTIQLSLHSSLDPELHLRLGAALAPLREEGVLIVGSGFATHNMGEMQMGGGGGGGPVRVPGWVSQFQTWLDETILRSTPTERVKRLAEADKQAPNFKRAHPRTEHFVPLLVSVGAATPDAVKEVFDGAAAVSTDGTTTAATSPTTHAVKNASSTTVELYSKVALGTALFASYSFQ